MFLSSLRPLTLIVIATLALSPFLQAQSKKDAEEPVLEPVPDQLVPNYLSTQQILIWEQALNDYKQGKDRIETGNYLQNRPPSALRTAAENIKAKAQGKQYVEQGKREVEAAEKTLSELRMIAAKAKANTTQVIEAVDYPLEFAPFSLQEALHPSLESLLYSVWNMGYTRIYFQGAYLIDTADDFPEHYQNKKLSEEISRLITRLDGNRFSYVKAPDLEFSVMSKGSKTYIEFPDRTSILRNFKSALIVAEVIYDPVNENALLSLRGIDLASSHLIATELLSLTIDDSIRSLVMTESDVLAAKEAAATSLEGETTIDSEKVEGTPKNVLGNIVAKRLNVNFRDTNNFLDRVSSSQGTYTFGIETVGDTTGFNNLAATVLAKEILIGKKLNVTDLDFLLLVLDAPAGGATVNNNAIWKLTPLSGVTEGRVSYDVEAISVSGAKRNSIPVGLMQTMFLEEDTLPVGGS